MTFSNYKKKWDLGRPPPFPQHSFFFSFRKLDGFPYLQRVKCLLLNNNRIVRIGESLELNLPRLDTLMLTNNSIQVSTSQTDRSRNCST